MNTLAILACIINISYLDIQIGGGFSHHNTIVLPRYCEANPEYIICKLTVEGERSKICAKQEYEQSTKRQIPSN